MSRDVNQKKHLRELATWARAVTKGQAESALFLGLWNDAVTLDPGKESVMIFQFGYALILDKPIVIVAPHGSTIPENIKRVARVIEFYDRDNRESLHAATTRALAAAGLDVKH